MPSLFMVMLGGRHARANTEVHDVVLAVGETLEQTYPQLKNAWFGEQKGLHIDAWAQISSVESEGKTYQLYFSDTAPAFTQEKLWLINLGGYDSQSFGELHRYVLVVASNAAQAKQRGKAHFAADWQKQHTDRVLEVDDCIAIEHVHGRYVHLQQANQLQNHWENCYIVI